MKKKNYLIVAVLLAFAISSFAQNITISSGGVPIATGINQILTYTVCDSTSLTMTVSYAGAMDHVIWSAVAGPGVYTPNNTSFTVTVGPVRTTTDYNVFVYDAPAHIAGWLKLTVFVSPLPLRQAALLNGQNAMNTTLHGCGLGVCSFTSSQVGYTYQMRNSLTKAPVGAPVTGTGVAIQFAPVSTGVNEVLMTSPFGCTLVNY